MDFDPNAAATADAGIFGLPFSVEASRVVLVPVPFEATTSYGRGTAKGPMAILEASMQVDLYDRQTGKPYETGIAMLAESEEVHAWNEAACALAEPIIASGGAAPEDENLAKVNELCTRMNQYVYETAMQLLSQGKIVGVVGGDHSTPFGSIKAHAEVFPGMGILHIDAHADLRDAYEGFVWSHASIMHNVLQYIPGVAKIVQVGIRDFCEAEFVRIQENERVKTFFDADLDEARFAGYHWQICCEEIIKDLPKDVYVSFDIDGLDPRFCPNTGTPVPGGLSFQEAIAILVELVRSGRRIVGFDLNEVAPAPEGTLGQAASWDANVGARLLYKLIGFALASRSTE